MNVNGVAAVVTGAASGLGEATARELARRGAKVAIFDRDQERGEQVAGEDGQIGQAAYSASKGGVLAMTLPIARDLMNEGVRVNTILPGVFKTPMVGMMPQNVQDALGAQVPFPKRLGQAEEYARLALFLIENVYMNAASVRLDGGIRMAPR